jgi:hypothetical protein
MNGGGWGPMEVFALPIVSDSDSEVTGARSTLVWALIALPRLPFLTRHIHNSLPH